MRSETENPEPVEPVAEPETEGGDDDEGGEDDDADPAPTQQKYTGGDIPRV